MPKCYHCDTYFVDSGHLLRHTCPAPFQHTPDVHTEPRGRMMWEWLRARECWPWAVLAAVVGAAFLWAGLMR